MPTTIEEKTETLRAPLAGEAGGSPLRLKNSEEMRAYLASHLTPVRYGPKGQPIYAHRDLATLNVIFPDVE